MNLPIQKFLRILESIWKNIPIRMGLGKIFCPIVTHVWSILILGILILEIILIHGIDFMVIEF